MNNPVDPESLPWSDAAERNGGPIASHLRGWFADCTRVLEIGAGTGQHAVRFAGELPTVRWCPSDREEVLPALRSRVAQARVANCESPVALDVFERSWPPGPWPAVYSANTLHIMSWAGVEALFRGLRSALADSGKFCVYGPFRYRGEFTSTSNARFDAMLRRRDPESGIRNFEEVNALAEAIGLKLVEDVAMPANNQLILWQRTS